MKIILTITLLAANIFGQQSLDHYVKFGQENNADVQSAFYLWKASQDEISVAKKLPNPMLSVGVFQESVETAVGPQEYKIGIMQKFPMFGKLGSASRAKSSQADALEQIYFQTLADVTAKIKSLYYDVYYLERAIDITQQNIHLLENWEKVIQTKYQTAQAGHLDFIKTQIELLKLQNDLKSLTTRKNPLLQEFRSVINDPSLVQIDHHDSLHVEWQELPKASVFQMIREKNHTLLAAEYSVSSRKSVLQRAKLQYLPDFGLGVDYIGTGEKEGSPNSGKDPLLFKFSIDLPIWFGKNAKEISAARYRKTAAENKLVSHQNRMIAAAENILFKMDDARRKIELYGNELIPKSRESLGASEKAYISDKADFLTLIDAQRRLLQFKLEYEKAIVSYLTHEAILESFLGIEE
jgi:outer membrane protein TolC